MEIAIWLNNFAPEEMFIDRLLRLIVKGLEFPKNKPTTTTTTTLSSIMNNDKKRRFILESSVIHDQCQRHLVDIFLYEFPLNFLKVLELILKRLTNRKLIPSILLVLLNGLMFEGQPETLEEIITNHITIPKIIEEFAENQKRLKLIDINNGIALFTKFFKTQRLQRQSVNNCQQSISGTAAAGTGGTSATKITDLYTIYSDYCPNINAWLSCLSQCFTVQILSTYTEILSDQRKF